jgi:hypothetical protein
MQPAVPHCERRLSGFISAPCCIGTLESLSRKNATIATEYIGASGAGYDKGSEGALRTTGEPN